MSSFPEELRQTYDELMKYVEAGNQDGISDPLIKLDKSVEIIGKAWSRSWLGYQSQIYYRDLSQPPPGAHFSSEWGIEDKLGGYGTKGDWVEYPFDSVVDSLQEMAGNPNLEAARNYFSDGKKFYEKDYEKTVITLEALNKGLKDEFLSGLLSEIKKIKIYSRQDFINSITPHPSSVSTRDSLAFSQGLRPPPHLWVGGEIVELRAPKSACEKLAKLTIRAASYLDALEKVKNGVKSMGIKIFIGHGHSNVWKDLKDFIKDRLKLDWDAYERVSTAGVPTSSRLEEMLDSSNFAFLVMTAEDETPEGKLNARLNVIHEVGLFQGRLGFKKAIVLLEDGCEGFSNIEGLGQIRFTAGNISAKFEEIRRVLEREGILKD